MNIEIGSKKIDFVYQGDNLIYPNYVAKENLVLHYDFSGMKNSDVTKAIARDLSGNGNNGVLQNFAYTNESGYLDNELIFDGVDDFITIPKPLIDLDNFTYSEGSEVLSFRGDEVATVVDGVVEIGGRNLILRTSRFNDVIIYDNRGTITDRGSNYITFYNQINTNAGILMMFAEELSTSDYILHFNIHSEKAFSLNYVSLRNGMRWSVIGLANKYMEKRSIAIGDNKIKYDISGASGANGLWLAFNNSEVITVTVSNLKLEKGNKATDWTPAPEDLETTTFKPLFDKKIKSALYWNRALTDEELLQVYNTQIKRI